MYCATCIMLYYDQQMHKCIKPMWNILIVNCIINKCIWNTCVTWQVTDYKLTEDDTLVSKRVEVW
jgi:hypothetical protein